jgi:sugar/nucleoside kinase (ribokinase family)
MDNGQMKHLIIGTTTIDLVISGMESLPRFDGDEFTASSLAFCDRPLGMSLGGNGANSAYVLGGLGAQVALCSAAGRDHLGELAVGWLEAKGVDLRGFVRSAQHSTATTTAIVDEAHNRLSFYHPGPLHDLTYNDLPAGLLDDARAVLVTGYALLPGFRPDGFAAVFRAARERDAITALDIGPAIRQPARLDELKPLLPLVDYLIANDYELSICAGEGAAVRLLAAGAKHVIIKHGAAGASVHSADRDAGVAVAGFPVDAAVTIGAGDSFNAGLLYALGRGLTPGEAVLWGNATAALVLRSGSVLGAPSFDQVAGLVGSAGSTPRF